MSQREASIARVATAPALDVPDPLWGSAAPLAIDRFHPRSSAHRPRTELRLLHDEACLHAAFEVHDRYVRCVSTRYQDPVCRDSCVELFLAPLRSDGSYDGYFNFELSCGGTLHLSHIRDPRRNGDGFVDFRRVEWADGRRVRVWSSLPRIVEPEIGEPTPWTLRLSIPFALFEPYVGRVSHRPGATWRANFYKCADATSHPHWASWAPIGERCDFHQPARFGIVRFG